MLKWAYQNANDDGSENNLILENKNEYKKIDFSKSNYVEEMEDEIKGLTLNQILDKINETGISSLSGFEKEILDEYSKN